VPQANIELEVYNLSFFNSEDFDDFEELHDEMQARVEHYRQLFLKESQETRRLERQLKKERQLTQSLKRLLKRVM
jgi:hypothetical protein